MKVTFDRYSLEPLLVKATNDELGITITPEDVSLFEWEEDEEGDVTAVSIEFELPKGKTA